MGEWPRRSIIKITSGQNIYGSSHWLGMGWSDCATPVANSQAKIKRLGSGAMPTKAKEAESLYRALRSVPDPRSRRGRDFPLSAMLVTTVLALYCNESTVSGIFRFFQDLSSQQRRSLGFRSKPAAPRVVPPPGEGCKRTALGAVDPEALASSLYVWMQGQSASVTLPALLSIDGKVIGNNLATIGDRGHHCFRRRTLLQKKSGSRCSSGARRRSPRSARSQSENHARRSYPSIKPRGSPFLHTEPELSHRRVDTRSVRYLSVTPMKVNIPCIFSVAEIHRDSTVKKTKIRTIGQRIYLSSRKAEPPASILKKVRLL
jgi:hypothetical protein